MTTIDLVQNMAHTGAPPRTPGYFGPMMSKTQAGAYVVTEYAGESHLAFDQPAGYKRLTTTKTATWGGTECR